MIRELFQHHGPLAATALLALLALGLPAAAGAEPPGGTADRARVAVYAGGVDLIPEVAYRRATLTVSGNGVDHRYDLAPGQSLSIGMFGPDGQLLADGVYTWELRLVPTEATAAELRRSAAENGGRALAAWTAQSGTFTIRGGIIADPALGEASRRRAAEPASASSLTPSFATVSSAAAGDDDFTVGSRADVEAAAKAAGRRSAAAADGALAPEMHLTVEDSDRAAPGRAPEATSAAADNQQFASSRTPRPRSDGSNGRPRS